MFWGYRIPLGLFSDGGVEKRRRWRGCHQWITSWKQWFQAFQDWFQIEISETVPGFSCRKSCRRWDRWVMGNHGESRNAKKCKAMRSIAKHARQWQWCATMICCPNAGLGYVDASRLLCFGPRSSKSTVSQSQGRVQGFWAFLFEIHMEIEIDQNESKWQCVTFVTCVTCVTSVCRNSWLQMFWHVLQRCSLLPTSGWGTRLHHSLTRRGEH